MKKFMVIGFIVITLSGCKGDNLVTVDDNYLIKDFEVVCLDGVEYLMSTYNNKGYMAVKIDKDTLLPSTCKE